MHERVILFPPIMHLHADAALGEYVDTDKAHSYRSPAIKGPVFKPDTTEHVSLENAGGNGENLRPFSANLAHHQALGEFKAAVDPDVTRPKQSVGIRMVPASSDSAWYPGNIYRKGKQRFNEAFEAIRSCTKE